MSTLYEISDEMLALAEKIEAADGELTPELENQMSEVFAKRDEKFAGYIYLIRDLHARAEAKQAEANELRQASNALFNRAVSLKKTLLQFMQQHNLSRVDAGHWQIRRQANGGEQPLQLPLLSEANAQKFQGFVKTETTHKWDSQAIRQALADGADLEFAQLLPRGEHLRIT